MCEHLTNTKDSSSPNNKDKNEFNSSTTSSACSVSSSSKNTSSSPRRSYTHNPYAFHNKSSQQQHHDAKKRSSINSNNSTSFANSTTSFPKSPAEIELQRGLDTMLITPDAAQNFHDSNNTLHRSLIGNVSFVPYPSEAVEFDYAFYESNISGSQSTRVFIGQLPYRVTEMQLQWIFYVFGHGTRIHNPERITKKAKTIGNARVPTGCIHCHIREDKVQGVLRCMHKRLLIDDSGIWYARSEQEQDLLEAYIQKLKKNPELRFPDRPYDTMVVQEAVSSYQSSQPRWVSNAPEAEKFAETTPSRKAQILALQQQKMMKMQKQQQQQQQQMQMHQVSPQHQQFYQQQQQQYNNTNNHYYYNNNGAAAADYTHHQQPQQPLMNTNVAASYNNNRNNYYHC